MEKLGKRQRKCSDLSIIYNHLKKNIFQVDAMLQNLEKEIDDVDAKIGDHWRVLDRWVKFLWVFFMCCKLSILFSQFWSFTVLGGEVDKGAQ